MSEARLWGEDDSLLSQWLGSMHSPEYQILLVSYEYQLMNALNWKLNSASAESLCKATVSLSAETQIQVP